MPAHRPPAHQEVLFAIAESLEGWEDRWADARQSAACVYVKAIGGPEDPENDERPNPA